MSIMAKRYFMFKWVGAFWMFTLLCVAFIGVFDHRTVNAAIPTTMDFQGFLTDPSGNPINGNQSVTFTIYDAVSGGNNLWTETQTVSVSNGLFNAVLGNWVEG